MYGDCNSVRGKDLHIVLTAVSIHPLNIILYEICCVPTESHNRRCRRLPVGWRQLPELLIYWSKRRIEKNGGLGETGGVCSPSVGGLSLHRSPYCGLVTHLWGAGAPRRLCALFRRWAARPRRSLRPRYW